MLSLILVWSHALQLLVLLRRLRLPPMGQWRIPRPLRIRIIIFMLLLQEVLPDLFVWLPLAFLPWGKFLEVSNSNSLIKLRIKAISYILKLLSKILTIIWTMINLAKRNHSFLIGQIIKINLTNLISQQIRINQTNRMALTKNHHLKKVRLLKRTNRHKKCTN